MVILSRFLGVAADPDHLHHQFGQPGKPLAEPDLVRAARSVGFKAGLVESRWERLAVLELPTIAGRRDGSFVVLAKMQGDAVLVQDPLGAGPRLLPRPEFEAQWSGRLLLLTKRTGLRPEDRRFDFTWFIPSIVKYRRLLGEVLVASFVLQLFGLVTPLFTQVVINKVLVHKGLTTLHVLAMGMLALALFDAILGGLRTHVFAHTTNRMDVGLGAQLYRHLLGLPFAYFETRRVGDTVARVRELETIRQFLTSSTVTVVLDVLFSAVFLAVMLLYSPVLTVVVLCSLPLYVILSVVVTPLFRKRLNDKFNRGAENQAFLVESINGIQTVKAMALEPSLQRKWEEQLAGYVQASFRATELGNLAGRVGGLINKVTTIAVLWFGAQLVIKEEMDIGQLIAFNMLAAQVTGPVLRIVNLWQDFQQAGISMQRLGDLLDTKPERPIDGMVQQLAVHTLGGVVTPAQQLLIVVPRDYPMEVEAQIENKDIGFIAVGQPVEIKVETFVFTRYGLIGGRVRTVSRDAVPLENGVLVYAAMISMDRSSMLVDGREVSLSPGMSVTVEIKTGQRRLIEYFLSPLLQAKQESFRER